MPSVLQDLVFWRLKTFFFSLISAMRLKIYFEIQKLNVAVFVLSTFLLYPLHAEDGENRASYYCLIGWRGGGGHRKYQRDKNTDKATEQDGAFTP